MEQQIKSGINIMFHFELDGTTYHPGLRCQDFVPRIGEMVTLSEPLFFGEVTAVMYQFSEDGNNWANVYLKNIERKP